MSEVHNVIWYLLEKTSVLYTFTDNSEIHGPNMSNSKVKLDIGAVCVKKDEPVSLMKNVVAGQVWWQILVEKWMHKFMRNVSSQFWVCDCIPQVSCLLIHKILTESLAIKICVRWMLKMLTDVHRQQYDNFFYSAGQQF